LIDYDINNDSVITAATAKGEDTAAEIE